MRCSWVILAVAIASSIASAVSAQMYIIPQGDCGSVILQTTRGADFPNLGETVASESVNGAYVYLPKRRVAMKPVVGARSVDFESDVPNDAVVMAAVDLKPVVAGNETRTEHAKAFILCGATTPCADWQRSAGLGFEIYPQGWNGPRPHLKPGDPMRFIAVDKATNTLIPDVSMELHRAGEGRISGGVPAQHGGMNFAYPEPGRYMVSTTYRRLDPKKPGHWIVDISTLTFDIK